MSTAWGACISQLHCPLLPTVLLKATLSSVQLWPAYTELPSEICGSANWVLFNAGMTWHFWFHNSQAMWPNDRHAWQQLLLQSLTKLGVHWVCVGCKTSNMQYAFRTHWMKCSSLERRKHQDKLWEKEVQKHKLQLFPPETCTSFFFADTSFFTPYTFLCMLWTIGFPWRHEANQTVLGEHFPTDTGAGGKKWTLGPCSTCGPPLCFPTFKALAAGRALSCSSHGVKQSLVLPKQHWVL